jgi:ribosomal protein L7/L12
MSKRLELKIALKQRREDLKAKTINPHTHSLLNRLDILEPEVIEAVVTLAKTPQWITGIKLLRALTGMSLREAKDFVDHYRWRNEQ